jgi:hypothetical protein
MLYVAANRREATAMFGEGALEGPPCVAASPLVRVEVAVA